MLTHAVLERVILTKVRISLSLVLLSLAFTACDSYPAKQIIRGEAQGTTYQVTYFDDSGIDMKSKTDSLLLDIDYSLSTYLENSIITRFNALDSGLFLDLDTFGHFNAVLSKSMFIYEQSKGAFDPSVKPLVDAWGFGLKKAEEMDSARVNELLKFKGFDTSGIVFTERSVQALMEGKRDLAYVKLRKGLQLDFNAIAQGYSVDQMANLFRSYEFENVLIELGGEMLAIGAKVDGAPWSVGIDKPKTEGERELEAIIDINNEAVATSGNYRKFYEKNGVKYSHTIDPLSGFPVQHSLLSATVITKDCATADALATVFMVMGLDRSVEWVEQNELEIDFLLIYSDVNGDMQTMSSPGLMAPEELTSD